MSIKKSNPVFFNCKPIASAVLQFQRHFFKSYFLRVVDNDHKRPHDDHKRPQAFAKDHK